MTPIKINLNRNGDYWQARWTDRAGRRRARSLGRIDPTGVDGLRERDALVALAQLETEINSGTMRSAGNASVRQIADDWLANRKAHVSKATYALYETAVRQILDQLNPRARARGIDVSDAMALRDWFMEKYKPSTASWKFTVASGIFARAVKRRFIDDNPFEMVDGPKVNIEREHAYVTLEEIERIIDAEPRPDYRAYFAMLRYAGLRANEPIRMTWDDIDFDARRLHVPGNPDGTITTKKKSRQVPMVPELHGVLLALFDAAEEGEVHPFEFVNLQTVLVRVKRRARRAGISKHVTLQALRVSRENDWVQEHPFLEVAKWMGHSPKVQAQNYHNVNLPTSQRVMDRAASATNSGTKQEQESPEKSENPC